MAAKEEKSQNGILKRLRQSFTHFAGWTISFVVSAVLDSIWIDEINAAYWRFLS